MESKLDQLIAVCRHLGYLEGLAHITKRTGYGVYHAESIDKAQAKMALLRYEILSGSSSFSVAEELDLVTTYDEQTQS